MGNVDVGGRPDVEAAGQDVRGCTWEDVEAALRMGWRVFPLWGLRLGGGSGDGGWICACPAGAECTQGAGKHPAVAGGFTVARGVADGQVGVDQVALWWAEGGGARNLGIRTGSVSDLLVVDVDARSGGLESVDQWCVGTGLTTELADLGARRVATGRLSDAVGGCAGHWYLRWDPEWLALGRAVVGKNGVLPGIDIKADGGYVVGVGSAHVSGGWYRWSDPGAAGGGSAVDGTFMAWLRDARGGGGGGGGGGSRPGVGGYSFREIRAGGSGAGAGTRDAYFNDLAFRLRCSGVVSWERAVAEVRTEWEKCAQPAGDEFAWDTALAKLERVWDTIPPGGFPQEKTPRVPLPRAELKSVGVGAETQSADITDAVVNIIAPGALAIPDVGRPGMSSVSAEEDIDTGIAGDPDGATGAATEGNHDTGNGLRYVRLFRDRARYVRELTQWFLWDDVDGHWKLDRIGRALEWTKEVIVDIRAEADLARIAGRTETATTWYRWAHSSSALGKRETLLRSASVEEGLRTEVEELDSARWLLALRGGMTVELDSGQVRSSSPGDLITRLAGVSWDDVLEARERLPGRGAGAVPGGGGNGAGWAGGLWETHVLRMVRGDVEAAAWLRRCAGYSLTGSVEEQSLPILHGDGENGKNVFMETLAAVWGGYAIKAQAGILTAADEEHPVGLYGLRGARLVFVDEVGRARINETRLKDITGGAIMRARDIGMTWVEFEMQGKVWVTANNLPAIKDSSHGMWRRIRRVELRGQIGKDGWKRENGYGERLLRECRGEVMAWALDGLREWRVMGLGSYPEMDRMSAQYRDEEDMFGLFIRECLVLNPALVPSGSFAVGSAGAGGVGEEEWSDQRALYSSYQLWCAVSQDRRERVLNYSYFGRELRKVLPGLRTERGREDGERIQRVYGVKLKSMN